MNYATARNTDGYLAGVDAILLLRDEFIEAHQTAVINNSIAQLGGTVEDWTYTELNEEQWEIWRSALPARSKWLDGIIIPSNPILLTLSKTSIESDGIDSTTLDINLQDVTYDGAVNLKIWTPTNTLVETTINAIAGIGQETITTLLDGTHRIVVETVPHGLQFISFEGI